MENSKLSGKYLSMIVGACSLMLGVSLLTTCLSFFIAPVTTDLNYSRAAFTLYYTLMTLGGMFTMPLWGAIIGKYGIKLSVVTSGVLASIALALLSFCSSLPSFYAVGIFLGVVYMGGTLLPAVIIVNNWFVARKGFFMGLVMAFSGVGGVIFSLILPGFLVSYGWRSGYLLLAALMLVVTVPAGLFLLRTKPADVGMEPYGFVEETSTSGTIAKEADGISANIAMKSPSFYLFFIAIVLVVVAVAIQYHLPAHLDSKGLAIGSLMAVMQFAVIFTKIGMGMSVDKIGVTPTMAVFFGLFIASSLGLIFVSSNSMATILVILLAFGAAFATVMPPLITDKMYGQKDYSVIYGTLGAASTLGTSLGVPIWGGVFDFSGSYDLGLYLAPVVVVLAFLVIVFCMKSAQKLWVKAS